MEGKYNTRSPAVKRLMKEAAELCSATADYQAAPLEENLFEWHFTVRGPADTDFQGGVYHGRILVPAEYPMKPPDIIVLTPNGRFEVGKKICLSISGHHPETWQPSWSIRTALLAIIGFMPSPAQGTIGSLDYSPEERRTLARRSLSWSCPSCGPATALLAPEEETQSPEQAREVQEIVETLQMKGEGVPGPEKEAVGDAAPPTPASEPAAATSEPSEVAVGAPAPAPSLTPVPVPTAPATNVNPASATNVRTRRTAPLRLGPAVQEQSLGRRQVYDLCIVLLVAAIAALLYRRVGLVQEGDASLADN